MPQKSSDFQFGKWFRKLDSNPFQKWCQNVEFVRRFRVTTMRGNEWKFLPFRCTFKRQVSLCSSIVVEEETFALGNRGRGKVFCLQILHSYAPPWHITRRGLVVIGLLTLPSSMELCCMELIEIEMEVFSDHRAPAPPRKVMKILYTPPYLRPQRS